MKVLLIIVVILSTTWRVSAEEIDCTTTYKLNEMSKEYYNTYCNESMLCKCFTRSGCPQQFSKDIAEGLAKFWYFNNQQLWLIFLCDEVLFEVHPTMDKQFLLVQTSNHYLTSYSKAVPLKKKGYVQFPVSSNFVPTVNTKGMFEIKLFITNPSLVYQKEMFGNHKNFDPNSQQLELHYSWYQFNDSNFYPTSIQVSFSDSSNSPESIENLFFGPFGGRGSQNEISIQLNKYTDLNKQSGRDFYLTVKAIDLGKDYSSTINNKITEIRYLSYHYICLGRKINAITKRYHWTGEGCRPVYYFNKDWERPALGRYAFYCHCDFKSLGLNYVDIVDKPQMPGFESPEPANKWIKSTKTINPSATTNFTVIFCSILLAIGGLAFLALGAYLVYYIFIK